MIPTAKSAALKKGHNYPNDVMEPNLTVVNDHILVSYPYDDTVEVFDLSGKFKFRKKITSLNVLDELDEKISRGSGRPASLFRFNKERYFHLKKEGIIFDI
mgnify:CR=1 FL=1